MTEQNWKRRYYLMDTDIESLQRKWNIMVIKRKRLLLSLRQEEEMIEIAEHFPEFIEEPHKKWMNTSLAERTDSLIGKVDELSEAISNK